MTTVDHTDLFESSRSNIHLAIRYKRERGDKSEKDVRPTRENASIFLYAKLFITTSAVAVLGIGSSQLTRTYWHRDASVHLGVL